MKIVPLTPDLFTRAAELFVQNFHQLRLDVPVLPDTLENPAEVAGLLKRLPAGAPGFAAFDHDEMAGYLGAFVFPDMRGTGRMGAFAPEWAHAATGNRAAVYRALYRAAAQQWTAAGVRMHGVALLASDQAACQAWFWNGFGLTVVDAIRPIDATGAVVPQGWELRAAAPEDAGLLAEIEIEHSRHYRQAPVFMAPNDPDNEEAFRNFLAEAPNSAWLALRDGEVGGYLRFQSRSEGAAEIVVSPQTIAITGAFVRPQLRGLGLASALLDAALRGYEGRGFTRCSVDFESFNPEAAAFWPRYFRPVVLSALRVPECIE